MKKTIQEIEQKTKTSEEERNRLDTTFTLTHNNFTDEGIVYEMFAEAKFFRHGKIAGNLPKRITEL